MWFGGAFCVLDVSPRVYIVSIYTELRLLMIDFGKITGFEWDEGNRDKKWDNHKVAWWGIEKFWARHDSTDYIDYKKAKRVQFPNLKPSSRAISIRLPESLIENIKVLANREEVPYQSMMKVLLAEKVTEALRSPKRKKTAA